MKTDTRVFVVTCLRVPLHRHVIERSANDLRPMKRCRTCGSRATVDEVTREEPSAKEIVALGVCNDNLKVASARFADAVSGFKKAFNGTISD